MSPPTWRPPINTLQRWEDKKVLQNSDRRRQDEHLYLEHDDDELPDDEKEIERFRSSILINVFMPLPMDPSLCPPTPLLKTTNRSSVARSQKHTVHPQSAFPSHLDWAPSQDPATLIRYLRAPASPVLNTYSASAPQHVREASARPPLHQALDWSDLNHQHPFTGCFARQGSSASAPAFASAPPFQPSYDSALTLDAQSAGTLITWAVGTGHSTAQASQKQDDYYSPLQSNCSIETHSSRCFQRAGRLKSLILHRQVCNR